MAGSIPDLHAEVRAGTGKGAARAARRANMVPGVVFGGDVDPQAIQVPFKDLLKKLKAGRFKSRLFNLKVDGQEDVRVICRDVQRDIVKDLPTHFDLMRLRRTTRISLFIHVDFINQDTCPGLKAGGVLTIVRPEVELNVLAGDIPDHISIDLANTELGDVLHISDVTLPEGAKTTVDRDFVIANISAPSGLKASDDEEEETADVEVPVVGAEEE